MNGFATFIGSRYLRSRKKRSISAIGAIAIAGVALGVASLSVVISISAGFEQEFTDKVLGVNSHLLVMKYGLDFTEYRDIMKQIKKIPTVRGLGPFVIQEMMIAHKDKSAGVLLKGIDPTIVADVLDLPKQLKAGSMEGLRVPGSGPSPPPRDDTSLTANVEKALEDASSDQDKDEKKAVGEPSSDTEGTGASDSKEAAALTRQAAPGIIIGRTLAEQLDAKVGEEVQITTPLIGLDVFGWAPTEDTPRTITFKIVGIFYAGFLEYDTKLAYVDYYQAQRFFNHGDAVTGIEITLTDRYKAKDAGRAVKSFLGEEGPYHTVDWMMLNEHLFTALMLQKTSLVIVMAVIVGVAAFNIIATLVMMVFDKRKEIAILKSMGATRAGIARIFLHVGLFVGLVGIAIGLTVGFGICYFLQEIGWPLDPNVYLIDHLPVRLDYMDFVLCAVIAFVICQAATILPSFSASKLHPVDGLRQD
jgi:lipoprotein-releasing system permease protein